MSLLMRVFGFIRALNPLFLVIGGLVAWHSFSEVRNYYEKREIIRQCSVVQQSDNQRTKILNRARSQNEKADKAIDNDEFDEWAAELQSDY